MSSVLINHVRTQNLSVPSSIAAKGSLWSMAVVFVNHSVKFW